MIFECYLPRPSQGFVIGAVFVTAEGTRRLISDDWLTKVELCDQGRFLRLTYTCCAIEVAGQQLEILFEDAVAGRLGTILQGPPMLVPCHRPWVSSLLALAPAAAVRGLDRR